MIFECYGDSKYYFDFVGFLQTVSCKFHFETGVGCRILIKISSRILIKIPGSSEQGQRIFAINITNNSKARLRKTKGYSEENNAQWKEKSFWV
jgi:hypothetical protein